MWVDVSGTFIECDARDRSHGSKDLWFIIGFNCVTSPLTEGNPVVLCVSIRDLSLLRTSGYRVGDALCDPYAVAHGGR